MTTNAQPQLRADRSATPLLSEKNIDEVLKAMTLEEKAKLLVGGANNFFSANAVLPTALPEYVSTQLVRVPQRHIMQQHSPSARAWPQHGIPTW